MDRNGNAATYTYSGGQLATMTDACGTVVTFDYTGRSDGQPVEVFCGSRSILYSYDLDDRLESITNPAGETTSFVYNAEGLIWKIIDPREEEAIVYTYGAMGRVIRESWYGLRTTETIYDKDARELADSYGLGNGPNWMAVRQIDESADPSPDRLVFQEFDFLGNVTQRAELVDETEQLFNITYIEYNDTNHPLLPTRVINPNGATTEMTYSSEGFWILRPTTTGTPGSTPTKITCRRSFRDLT
ncbi:MAG: RHS repeat protein [Candidatus Eremiobacteraeota bacterium]|nr:RHS repeat protein [Candidatus Eremiobacteraeota bacterium]MCW5869747.1 RHS repeat protein [Candidatus Eremiobacteraeota bacterium]